MTDLCGHDYLRMTLAAALLAGLNAGTCTGLADDETGTLEVTARRFDGPAAGLVYVERESWQNVGGNRQQVWAYASQRELDTGKCTLRLAPGNYRAVLRLAETESDARVFKLEAAQTKSLVFEVATLQIVSRTCAGPSAWAEIWLEQKRPGNAGDKEAPRWHYLGFRKLTDGTLAIDVVAGEYRLRYCTGTLWTEARPVNLDGGQRRLLTYYIPTIEVGARWPDGVATAGKARIEQHRPPWARPGQEWVPVGTWPLRTSAFTKSLLPGRYRVQFESSGRPITSEPFRIAWMDGMRVTFDVAASACTSEYRELRKVQIEDVLRLWGGGKADATYDPASLSPREAQALLDRARAGLTLPPELTDKALDALITKVTPSASQQSRALQRAAARYLLASDQVARADARQQLHRALEAAARK